MSSATALCLSVMPTTNANGRTVSLHSSSEIPSRWLHPVWERLGDGVAAEVLARVGLPANRLPVRPLRASQGHAARHQGCRVRHLRAAAGTAARMTPGETSTVIKTIIVCYATHYRSHCHIFVLMHSHFLAKYLAIIHTTCTLQLNMGTCLSLTCSYLYTLRIFLCPWISSCSNVLVQLLRTIASCPRSRPQFINFPTCPLLFFTWQLLQK